MTSPPPEATKAVLGQACRALRRRLSPLAWMVLEEVALDADADMTAATSARRIAVQLGVDPGSASRALRLLRDGGLLRLDRAAAAHGRFGLARYVLCAPAGIAVVAGGSDTTCMQEPGVVEPCAVEPHVAGDAAVGHRDVPNVRPKDSEPRLDRKPGHRRRTAVFARKRGGRSARCAAAGRAGVAVGVDLVSARSARSVGLPGGVASVCPASGWRLPFGDRWLTDVAAGGGWGADDHGVVERRVPGRVGGVGDRRVLRRCRRSAGRVDGPVGRRPRPRRASSRPTTSATSSTASTHARASSLVSGRPRTVKALDLTFSAPKSVSVAWALGTDRVHTAVSRAHVEAVEVAVGFLEERAGVARHQEGGVRRRVPTDGWAVAGFVHRTSTGGRPAAPHPLPAPQPVPPDQRRSGGGDRRRPPVRVAPSGRARLPERGPTAADRRARASSGARTGPTPATWSASTGRPARCSRSGPLRSTRELDAAGTRLRRCRRCGCGPTTRPPSPPAPLKDHALDPGPPRRPVDRRSGRRRRPGRRRPRPRHLRPRPTVEVRPSREVLWAGLVDPDGGVCANDPRFSRGRRRRPPRRRVRRPAHPRRDHRRSHSVPRLRPRRPPHPRPSRRGGPQAGAVVDRRPPPASRTASSACSTASKPTPATAVPTRRSTRRWRPVRSSTLTRSPRSGSSAPASARSRVVLAAGRLRQDRHGPRRRRPPQQPRAGRCSAWRPRPRRSPSSTAPASPPSPSPASASTSTRRPSPAGHGRRARRGVPDLHPRRRDRPRRRRRLPRRAGVGPRRPPPRPLRPRRRPRRRARQPGPTPTAHPGRVAGRQPPSGRPRRPGRPRPPPLRSRHRARRRCGPTSGWEHDAGTPEATRTAMAAAVADDISRHGPAQVVALTVSHGDAEDLADRIRRHLTATGALTGPGLTGPGWTTDRTYQAGDRILLHARCGATS